MKHLHFDEIGSTQEYLKQNFESLKTENVNVLISTSHQTLGHGRQGHRWIDFKNNLAFSFSLKPSQPTTLSSLEIGIHIVQFFSKYCKNKISLKWPNDIINSKLEKCGGIICQLQDSTILAGVGINFNSIDSEIKTVLRKPGTFQVGSLTSKDNFESQFKEEWPLKFYQYLLENRLSNEQIIKLWNQYCCHRDSSISLWENEKEILNGQFVGIGSMGQAQILKANGELIDAYSGSVLFNENL